jgi:hypothetical protein
MQTTTQTTQAPTTQAAQARKGWATVKARLESGDDKGCRHLMRFAECLLAAFDAGKTSLTWAEINATTHDKRGLRAANPADAWQFYLSSRLKVVDPAGVFAHVKVDPAGKRLVWADDKPAPAAAAPKGMQKAPRPAGK